LSGQLQQDQSFLIFPNLALNILWQARAPKEEVESLKDRSIFVLLLMWTGVYLLFFFRSLDKNNPTREYFFRNNGNSPEDP
jgi:hypothetical protein